MIAIVTAGGTIAPDQPLYEVTHGGWKSMIDIHGKPMVQWVLDALGKSSRVDRVIVVGLPPETDLLCARPLTVLPDHGDMLANVRAGAQEAQSLDLQSTYALLISADIPTIRSEMIDWLVDQAGELDQDIYYTIVERANMENLFPDARRTYIHLKNMQVCGGDMHCFRLGAVVEESPMWNRLIAARKSPLRQASLLGYDTLMFLMLRRLSLEDAEATVCKRLGIRGRALLCPYPEVGMDVDKPFQLQIVRSYLSRGEEHGAERV